LCTVLQPTLLSITLLLLLLAAAVVTIAAHCCSLSPADDLDLIASRLSQLTCLGLSLPVGVGTQLVDLRALAPLTNMRQVSRRQQQQQ
jgi:hypothetical protein